MSGRAETSGHPFKDDFARYYDLLYSDKDYAGEADLIDRILREESRPPAKTLLDAGCGTAGHAVLLAKKGYRVVGIDRMGSMLRIAREKATRERVAVDFREADLRSLELGMTCDAAISMFAVLSFQLENEALQSSLRSIRRHLTPRGLFICDMWHGAAVLTEGLQNRLKTIERDGVRLLRFATPRMDAIRQTATVDHHLIVTTSDGKVEAEVRESQTVRFVFAMEMAHHLEASGFDLVRFFDFPRYDDPPTDHSWNLGVVARARA